jgi:hypothetical protein
VAVSSDAHWDSTSSTWRGDVDAVSAVFTKPPECGRGSMGQNRRRPAGENRSHAMSVWGKKLFLLRAIDTVVDTVKTARSNPLPSQLSIESHVAQLPESKDPMLSSGQVCDLPVETRPRQPPTGRFRSI